MILKLFSLFGILGILAQSALGNDQMRGWTLTSGERKQAEILGFDEEQRTVTLRLSDQSEIQLSEEDLSTIDRAWVLQWIEKNEEDRGNLEKVGGSVTEHRSTGKFATDYAVYHPPLAEEAPEGPMLILFHPSGNGRRSIYRYIEAAAATGFTVVSLDYFRNNSDKAKSDEMFERFQDLLPQIEAVILHDRTRVFVGGMSGGASRAYNYTARVDRPWAGVVAYGGWLGGRKNYSLPYPKMRIAMVNGDKDAGANSYIDSDSECLQKSGGVVSVHAFEGGHQLAPPSVQEKAMRWLLQESP